MPWSDMADRMLGVAVRTFRHADQDGQSLVEYIPKAGSAYIIESAVFDEAHISIDQDTGASISSTNPVLGIQLSQMQGPITRGDKARVTVKGVATVYVVADHQPDGVAGALLKLHKQ